MESQNIFYVAEIKEDGTLKLFCANVTFSIEEAKELATTMANASKKTFRIIEVPANVLLLDVITEE